MTETTKTRHTKQEEDKETNLLFSGIAVRDVMVQPRTCILDDRSVTGVDQTGLEIGQFGQRLHVVMEIFKHLGDKTGELDQLQ